MRDLVVVGCGGHGREVIDTVFALNRRAPTWNLLGVVDDDPSRSDRLERLGVPLLGPVAHLSEHPCTFVLGIGASAVRGALAEQLEGSGMEPATIVHPGATIGADVELDRGVVVFDRTTITTNVRIGAHTHLNVGCAVQHDTVVGEYVQFSPGVFVNGDVVLGDGVFLGTGAIVTRGCRVGNGALVGAGAVVIDDVEPGRTVVGVPARPTVGRKGAATGQDRYQPRENP